MSRPVSHTTAWNSGRLVWPKMPHAGLPLLFKYGRRDFFFKFRTIFFIRKSNI